MSFSGVVLAGGRSARMGADKATLVVEGRPLAARSLAALRAAGAAEVLSIGGDVAALAAMGFDARPDDYPDEGPLGGLLTGLRLAAHEIVGVLACDLPRADAAGVEAVVAALAEGEEDAAVPVVGGRAQPLHAAYRPACIGLLERAFDAGERSPVRALELLRVRTVTLADPRWAADADTPRDLMTDPRG